jgi:tripartite motif-containing protein 2/3
VNRHIVLELRGAAFRAAFFVLSIAAGCGSSLDDSPKTVAAEVTMARYRHTQMQTEVRWAAVTEAGVVRVRIHRSLDATLDEGDEEAWVVEASDAGSFIYGYEGTPDANAYFILEAEFEDGERASSAALLERGLHLPRFQMGGSGTGDGEFDYPGDVAIDAEGRSYVADSGNGRIVIFDAEGDFVANHPVGTSNNYYIELAPDGTIFSAETASERVAVYTTSDQAFLREYAPITRPYDMAIADDGTVWVTNDVDGVVEFAQGATSDPLDVTLADLANGAVARAVDIELSPDQQRLYVLDNGATSHFVQIFDREWNHLGSIGVAGDPEANEGELADCWGMAVAPDGFVYAFDWDHYVNVFSPTGEFFDRFEPPSGLGAGIWDADFDAEGNLAMTEASNDLVFFRTP